MRGFKQSIYWKLLFTFFGSLIIASSLVGIMFSLIDASPEYPQIKRALVQETQMIAERITPLLHDASIPLESTLKEIYEKYEVNTRVFDTQGNELASSMKDNLKSVKTISPSIIEKTFRQGGYCWFTDPWWRRIYVASVPLTIGEKHIGILQNYYTPMRKGSIMPFYGAQLYIPIIIIALFTALLSRFLTNPIRELRKAAEKMSKGNFDVRVKVRSEDEIGQLGEAFNEMSQRLADFRKSRRELLADISHEIRSPLARIQSDAEILIDRKMEKDEREQHLKAICEDVKDINKLVEDLSMLSLLHHKQFELEISPSSLQDVLSQEISKFRLQREKKGINLIQTIPANTSLVMMDAKRIGQVISNLLTNALRYTPKEGTVDVGLKEKDSLVEVWVRDTGPGIPQEELPHIFDRFYRVDKSRSRTSGGTGLGLAIAKYFVEAQGGLIRAESEVGKGTCITFSLPIAT